MPPNNQNEERCPTCGAARNAIPTPAQAQPISLSVDRFFAQHPDFLALPIDAKTEVFLSYLDSIPCPHALPDMYLPRLAFQIQNPGFYARTPEARTLAILEYLIRNNPHNIVPVRASPRDRPQPHVLWECEWASCGEVSWRRLDRKRHFLLCVSLDGDGVADLVLDATVLCTSSHHFTNWRKILIGHSAWDTRQVMKKRWWIGIWRKELSTWQLEIDEGLSWGWIW